MRLPRSSVALLVVVACSCGGAAASESDPVRCGPGTVLEDGVCVVARADAGADAGAVVAEDAGATGCTDVDLTATTQPLDDALFPRVVSLRGGRALLVDQTRGVRARPIDASGTLAGPARAVVDLGPAANVLSRTESALTDDRAVVAWTERSGANEIAVLDAGGRPVARAPLPGDVGLVLGSAPTERGFRLLATRVTNTATEIVVLDGDGDGKLGAPRVLPLGEGASFEPTAALARFGPDTLAVVAVVPPGGSGRVLTGFRLDAAGTVSPPFEIARTAQVAPLSVVGTGDGALLAWGDGSLAPGGTFKKQLMLHVVRLSRSGAETTARELASRPLLVVGNRASEAALTAASGQAWLVERGSLLLGVPIDASGPRPGDGLSLRQEAFLTDVAAGATRDALIVAWSARPEGARGSVQLAAYRCRR